MVVSVNPMHVFTVEFVRFSTEEIVDLETKCSTYGLAQRDTASDWISEVLNGGFKSRHLGKFTLLMLFCVSWLRGSVA